MRGTGGKAEDRGIGIRGIPGTVACRGFLFSEFTLEVLGLLVDGEGAALEVLVSGGDVGVSGLIAGDDNAGRVGEVADAGVLQAVELISAWKAEESTYLGEVVTEDA